MMSKRHVVRPHAILICEDGWQGIRAFALGLSQQHIPVSVIVKGDPGKAVRRVISPQPLVRNYFLPRTQYRFFLYPLLAWLLLGRRGHVCCATNTRTLRTLQRFQTLARFALYRFIDAGPDSFLQDERGKTFLPRESLEHLRSTTKS